MKLALTLYRPLETTLQGRKIMKLLTLLIRPYLSHKFFGGKHELVVDHPSWLLLEQAAVRVNLDCLKSKGKKKRKETKHIS